MRLTVILTLVILEVFGPTVINCEKIVFVVPRYIKRSYTTSASDSNPFYNNFKSRGLKKRPYFNDYSTTTNEPGPAFFNGEKYRRPAPQRYQHQQGENDFGQGSFFNNNNHHQEVNHVVIPHGKGISHGISFGKEYIPENEFKEMMNENYEFSTTNNENQVDYTSQNYNNNEDVKFGDNYDHQYPRFENQKDNWQFSSGNSDNNYNVNPVDLNQQTNHEDNRFGSLDEFYKNQGLMNNKNNVNFYHSTSNQDSLQARILPENLSSSGISAARLTASPPAPLPSSPKQFQTAAPIILHDTIDMKEYVEKIQAFAKSWPPAAGIQGFGLNNQQFNNLQGTNFGLPNSWSNNSPRTTMMTAGSSYEVQEENTEEPNNNNNNNNNYNNYGNFRSMRIQG